jgi:NADP-dependent 3-hydroxy acid dehydrogenase YdfG
MVIVAQKNSNRKIMNENIAGKIIIITGASSALGEAAATYLDQHGATIVMGARRIERIQQLAIDIDHSGGKPWRFIQTSPAMKT